MVTVHVVTSAGVGLPYDVLEAGVPISAPASRTGIAHFRNRGASTLTLLVPVTGPFGDMNAALSVPAGADRFVSLSDRLSADGKTITFTPNGDLTDADVTFFERDILDRA